MANFWEDLGDFAGWGSARRQRKFNATEAQKNRDWQTMMQNTAHQREVADLKAAGINPVLTATGSSISNTPGGAVASSAQAQNSLPQYMQAASNLINSIRQSEEAKYSRNAVSSAIKIAKLLGKYL